MGKYGKYGEILVSANGSLGSCEPFLEAPAPLGCSHEPPPPAAAAAPEAHALPPQLLAPGFTPISPWPLKNLEVEVNLF